MKATIEKPMILKAAATLANGGYNGSLLQFERIGDKMRLCGTNCYVMVLAAVDARFSCWADGEGFMLRGPEVQAMMRGISKGIKNAASVTVEAVKGAAVITMDVEGAAISTSFKLENAGKLVNLNAIEESCKVQSEPGDVLAVASYFMGLASNAMRTIGGGKHSAWTFKDHGETRPMEFISKEEPARVLLMPTR